MVVLSRSFLTLYFGFFNKRQQKRRGSSLCFCSEMSVLFTCVDPEIFIRGGPTLTTVFYVVFLS